MHLMVILANWWSRKKIIAIPENSKDKDLRDEIGIDVGDINPNPKYGDDHILWFFLERDSRVSNTNDTYPGAFNLGPLEAKYVAWTQGGHLTSF